MRQEVEREIVLDAEPAEVWRELTESDWLGEDARIELEPGGDLELVDREEGRAPAGSRRSSPSGG